MKATFCPPASPLNTNELEDFGDFANEVGNNSCSSERSFDATREYFDWRTAKVVRMHSSRSLVDEDESELADCAVLPMDKGDEYMNISKNKKSKSDKKEKSRRKVRQLSEIPEEPILEKRKKKSRKSTRRVVHLELPAIQENLEHNATDFMAVPKDTPLFLENKKCNSEKKKPVKSRSHLTTSMEGIPEEGEPLQTNPSALYPTYDDELNESVYATPLSTTNTSLDLAKVHKKTHCEGDLLSYEISLASQCHDHIKDFATKESLIRSMGQVQLTAATSPALPLRSRVSLEFDKLVSNRSSTAMKPDNELNESVDATPLIPADKLLEFNKKKHREADLHLHQISLSSQCHDQLDHFETKQSLIRSMGQVQLTTAPSPILPLRSRVSLDFDMLVSNRSSFRVKDELAVYGQNDESAERLDTPYPNLSLIAKAVERDKERRQLHANQRAAAKTAAISKPLWPNAPVPAPRPTSPSSSTRPTCAAEDDDRSVESMDTPFPDQSLVAKAVAKDKERRQLLAARRAAFAAATISKPLWTTLPVAAPGHTSSPSSTRPSCVDEEYDQSVNSTDTPFPDLSLMAKAVAKDKEHRQLHATQRAAAKAAAFSKPLWPNAPVPEPTPTSSSSSTIPAYAAEDDDRSVESMDTPFPDQSLVAKAVEKDKERRQLRAAQRAAAKAATISKRMWPETASTVSPTAVGLVCFDTSCQSLRSLDNKSGEEYVAKRTTIQAAASNPHSQTMHSKQDRSSLDKCYQMDHRMNMQQALSSFEEVYGKVKSAHTSAASEHSLLSMKAVGKYSNQQERADIFLRAAAKAVASRAIEPSKQNWTMDEIMNTFVAADQAAFSSRAKQFTEDRVMRQIHVPRNVSRPAQNLE